MPPTISGLHLSNWLPARSNCRLEWVGLREQFPQVTHTIGLKCPDLEPDLIDLTYGSADNAPRQTGGKRRSRTNRVNIEGCPNWQIDPDGSLFYKRQKTDPDGKVPKIDLGPSAQPPVIPAHGDGGRERFVDELVCWHFNRRLSVSLQRIAHVVHRDGDWSNCAASNVFQMLDADVMWEQKMRAWMASSIPAKRLKTAGAASFGGLRSVTVPTDLREGGVIAALPEWADVVPIWVQDRFKTIEQEKTCA